MSQLRYYCVHISTHGSRFFTTAVRWSLPFTTKQEARRYGKGKIDAGDASLAFVIEANGADRDLIETLPERAKKIVDHYEDVLALLDKPAKTH